MHLANYLLFENRAAEAFDFYAKCLGGKIAMKVTYGEMPGSDGWPPEAENQLAHIRLEVGDAVLMGSDWCAPRPYPGIQGNAVSLTVDTPDEAEQLFRTLSDGGDVAMPIGETSWARRFGMFTDRFGAFWMINCHRPQTERQS